MTTTTKRDDQWRHWLREHARAFVIADEPLWAELLTVLADSNGPEDTGPITLTSQSDRARVLMTSPTEDVYLAAIDYLGRHVDLSPEEPVRWMLDDKDVRGLAATIGAAGVAAGRAQAATDIRAMAADERAIFNRFGDPHDAIADALEDAATIAEGGEPRG